MKYVIIGGVAGGATVAARLRRLDEKAEIIILEKGEHISYANCGLPYYVGNVIKDRSSLLLQTPKSFDERFNIEVRIFNEVVDINSSEKTVRIKRLTSNEVYTETYDKLIMSPGALPIVPPIKGIENTSILSVRNVADTDKIKEKITKEGIRTAVVVGAGFIGLEMAENLHKLGVETTVIEAGAQVMNALDIEMAAELHQQFKQHNVGLYLEKAVKEFEQTNENTINITLNDNTKILTEIVILSIGVKPDNTLALKAGISTNERGMIIVDEKMQTSQDDIFALGDVVLSKNKITGIDQPFFLAGPANKQARILANFLAKNKSSKYNGAIGTAIAKVFDMQVATTGISEKLAKQLNIDYKVSLIKASSHAGYYPGAKQITLKLIFSPSTGKILGAQGVGEEGVDKRIDIIATAIGLGATIYDLQEIEHAYAPPFSSAKDPVNQLAFYAENIIDGLVEVINLQDIICAEDNVLILDVRTKSEFELGAIEKAINIPLDSLRSNLDKLPKDKKIYLYCKAGLRGYLASRILKQHGFKLVYNLSGGYDLFKLYIKPQENKITTRKSETRTEIELPVANISVDAIGMQCPGPIIKLKEEISNIQQNQILKITTSDAGFSSDVDSWCKVTGNELVNVSKESGNIVAYIRKRDMKQTLPENTNNKTIVVFSDDLDKALASFVIANGAVAMGKKVSMFFTFWGLNVIKKHEKPTVSKDFMGKMFSLMMPKSSRGLNLSKMKFWGLGKIMMRNRMADLKVESLENMISQAKFAGVEFIACQMSMDVMGISKEELMNEIKIGGVANYLERAESSNHNLFI